MVETGGDGGDGGPGPNITILYASATDDADGSAHAAGSGGRAEPAVPVARETRRADAGQGGGRAPTAQPGAVNIRQVAAEEVWSLLDADSAREWAAYRAEVAGYLLRKFDYESQLVALS